MSEKKVTAISSIHNLNYYINAFIKRNKDKIKNPLFEQYIKYFLGNVIQLDFLTNDNDYLLKLLQDQFLFFCKNSPSKLKIQLQNRDKKNYNLIKDIENKQFLTIIQINLPDIPFLIDSFIGKINESGYKVKTLVNVILNTKRDGEGHLLHIMPVQDDNKASDHITHLESLIYIEISDITNVDINKEILDNLLNLYDKINIVVADWSIMLEQLLAVTGKMQSLYIKHEHNNVVSEAIEFLKWASDEAFVFLGSSEFNIKETDDIISFIEDKKKSAGLCRIAKEGATLIDDLLVIKKINLKIDFIKHPFIIDIIKSSIVSDVHRKAHIIIIRLQKFDQNYNVVGEYRFYGLFTSMVYFQPPKTIPIIRTKIQYILDKITFPIYSHNGKELVSILDYYPRDELLQINKELLYDHCIQSVALSGSSKFKIFIRYDKFNRFISCICYIPKENFSTSIRKKMEAVLCSTFNGIVTNHYTQVTDFPLTRLILILSLNEPIVSSVNIIALEKKLDLLTSLWSEELFRVFRKHKKYSELEKLYKIYEHAFPASYTEIFNAEQAFFDIFKIQESLNINKHIFHLSVNSSNDEYCLKLYQPLNPITLSHIMPIIEHYGIQVLSEQVYKVTPIINGKENIFLIYNFIIKIANESPNIHKATEIFEEAITHTWDKKIEDDSLNSLLLKCHIHWRYIILIRAYTKYLKQIQHTYSLEYIANILQNNVAISYLLIELFKIKFSLEVEKSKREQSLKDIMKKIEVEFSKVNNIAEDNVLRRFLNAIDATLRTNFYQKDEKGAYKDYISFKIDPGKVLNMPLPKPFRSIFVYSSYTEAIHLRGDKIARGGLRWSNRFEDFRTEIHGLMKAQMIKNAVIVPMGSKGGFVVKKDLTEMDKAETLKEGIKCYKTFLRGMLDITDNIINDKVVSPKNVIKYDEDDPYLVVAADKGTATFSDIANTISAEYNFWLGDAFASGGSQGYDHKKMGITARGAWIAVQRHFMEMGIDVQSEEFTVVGIGGMSGDVFGNGMLLSKYIKLVLAFNHINIFIDPNPDLENSYKERKRLFENARSTWADYNPALISQGGGIFSRNAKEIMLSLEAKELLKIEEDVVSGNQLIQYILKAKVDLIWNGGIGTYIKASTESHNDVKDHANDLVRVDANEVRAKVIGEGGNLGLTQKARIEYSLNGGRINNDSIDNSAGVDCSDHEVNIKIALTHAISEKRLSVGDRNNLLATMTEEVANLVLYNNHLQTLAISKECFHSFFHIAEHQKLIQNFEKEGFLNRTVECLPTNKEIEDRIVNKQGLTRPEICVLFSYCKMYLYNKLINSAFADDEHLHLDLLNYFPKILVKNLEKDILAHKLKKEIIVTTLANNTINHIGCVFVFKVVESTGESYYNVLRSLVITHDVFNVQALLKSVEDLGSYINTELQFEIYLRINKILENGALWFLADIKTIPNLTYAITKYKQPIAELENNLLSLLPNSMQEKYTKKINSLIEQNVPESLASKLIFSEILSRSCDIVRISQLLEVSLHFVAQIFFKLERVFHIESLTKLLESSSTQSEWKKLSCRVLLSNLTKNHARLTYEVISMAKKERQLKSCDKIFNIWTKINTDNLKKYESIIKQIRLKNRVDTDIITIIINQLSNIKESDFVQ